MNCRTTTFPANWPSVKFFPLLASVRGAFFHAELAIWIGRAEEPAVVRDREYAPTMIMINTVPRMREFLFQWDFFTQLFARWGELGGAGLDAGRGLPCLFFCLAKQYCREDSTLLLPLKNTSNR